MNIHIVKKYRTYSYKAKRITCSKSNNTKKNKNIPVYKIIIWILSIIIIPIFTAFVSDYLIEQTLKNVAREEKLNMQIETLENIYIGCSKEWIDEKLGAPTFIYSTSKINSYNDNYKSEYDNDYISCVYSTDIAVLKVYYLKENISCKAYYITSTNKDCHINLPKAYRRFVNNKSIGDFSYYDINGAPEIVGGGISNGNMREFYGELFNYNSAGNYYSFIFGFLDYGIEVPFKLFPPGTEIEWDDKTVNCKPKIKGIHNINNRKENTPNTFGIADGSISYETAWYLLSDSYGFDSFQLKKQPHEYIDTMKKVDIDEIE